MKHFQSIVRLADYFDYQLFSYAGVQEDKQYLQEKYSDLRVEISSLPDKYIKWLFLRFGENPTIQETHPLQDCISTLNNFVKKQHSISQKYNSQDTFKKCIDEKYPPHTRGWSNPADIMRITADQMEFFLSLNERPTDNKAVDGLQAEGLAYSLPEEDRVGKVGEWNLWLPSNRENSCKIAGYDPITLKPYTTWCTARTSGSNLFYNYIGGTSGKVMLFYLIKDNPQTDQDWLSIGFVKGEPRLKGEDGGVSVNRDNKGLTPEILQSILGSNYQPILDILKEKNDSLGGISPAYSKIKEASQNLSFFKSLIKGNSQEEIDIIILQIAHRMPDTSKEVLLEMVNRTNDKESLQMIKRGQRLDGEVLIAFLQKGNVLDRDFRSEIVSSIYSKEDLLKAIPLVKDQSILLREIVKNIKSDEEVALKVIELTDSPKDIGFITKKMKDNKKFIEASSAIIKSKLSNKIESIREEIETMYDTDNFDKYKEVMENVESIIKNPITDEDMLLEIIQKIEIGEDLLIFCILKTSLEKNFLTEALKQVKYNESLDWIKRNLAQHFPMGPQTLEIFSNREKELGGSKKEDQDILFATANLFYQMAISGR